VNAKRISILIPAALAAATLAACGEKDEPATTGPVVPETTTEATTTGGTTTTDQPGNDKLAISGVVTEFLTKANSPDACTKLVTPAFVRRSYGSVKGCKAARKPSAMATNVTIEPAHSGARGTVVKAKPKGGVFGGETLSVTVINLDGQWTIDRITSNVKVGP
jgi:hypothetical protein